MAHRTGMRRAYAAPSVGWAYGTFGAIASGITLTSLIVRYFEIGLAAITREILRRYAEIVHPLMDFLLAWVAWFLPTWVVPDWAKDLLALSLVGAGGVARATYQLRQDEKFSEVERWAGNRIQSIHLYVTEYRPPAVRWDVARAALLFIALGFSFLGAIAVLASVLWVPVMFVDMLYPIYNPDQRRRYQGLVFTVIGGVMGSAVFLLLNEMWKSNP